MLDELTRTCGEQTETGARWHPRGKLRLLLRPCWISEPSIRAPSIRER